MSSASRPSLSLPNARPYPFDFPLATTALVIIDIQRDFVDPGGFGSVQCGNDEIFSKARSIVPAVQRVLEIFRSTRGHVIHTREGHQPDLADLPAAKKLRQINNPNGHHFMGIGDQGPMGRLLVRGEYGHDIIDELQPWPTEVVIDKPGKGSFWGTDIHRVLLARGITHLLFAGVTTECCVTTTLRECNDRGYQCCVLEDCTQGFDAQQVTTSLDTICAQDGLFGFVGNSADFLTATKDVSTAPVSQLGVSGPFPSIDDLQALYKDGQTTPTDVVNAAFDRIEAYQNEDPAVWTSLAKRADVLVAAKALAEKYKEKPLPPLFGVPFGVKDSIDVEGIETTAACPSYAYVPKATATCVQHILDAGGIYVGKTNLDQLATGLSGCRSPYGVPHSIFSKDLIAGGSSSGGCVAVAARLVPFTVATDTAGSGRVPAAFNGVVGFKPTKGTISARGLIPACKTLDSIAIVATSVADARAVWRVIAKHDKADPYSKLPHTLPTWKTDFRGLKDGGFDFAVPPPAALEACTPEYRRLFAEAVKKLQSAGGRLRNTDWEAFERAGELLYEGALLHERITCIGREFLRSSIQDGGLHPVIQKLFSDALNKAPDAYDVFRDQATQAELSRRTHMAFDTLSGGVDVLVVPTTVCHPTFEEIAADPIRLNARLGTFTHFANIVDLCGLSVPAGTYLDEKETELPFGVTILAGSGFDAKALDVARVLEEVIKAK
ncbi:glutamyl-tRNA(Gln) amidotransferase subunit A [Verticillium alfalfae VaMs.102]|uniref:Glutamyl-tRNA(Gln) amidotransferase subunit A n=1 Tax=Verticillium alfalfae (strain VaMs.102 / ATCC MYA-4576 / FGSC 10136) TaxID=526221 RepID=C9SYT1_VERA1|nr:glutamyl-tRNA(Gln) amidotransferase subunit A [Verticillium alfalfae VaMs.102]EEY23946.1 glutamyl-tRNA(Gln) amidotransferase subunit A [Verticillium alfalfae VaMs.102]